MTLKLEGVVVPTITPRFNSSVDLQSVSRLMEFLVAGGIDAIFALGTTGEFQYLSLEEKRQVIEVSSHALGSRMPLLVGISAHTIEETLELVHLARGSGAQALVLAPMFGETDPAEQVRIVLKNVSLPVVLYNNPGIQGQRSLPFEMIEDVASHSAIAGVKDSSGDRDYFEKLLALRRPGFCVLQGRESMVLQSLQDGADGFVPGVGNIDPGLCRDLWLKRDQDSQDRLMALKAEIKKAYASSIPGFKQRLVEMGIIRSAAIFSGRPGNGD